MDSGKPNQKICFVLRMIYPPLVVLLAALSLTGCGGKSIDRERFAESTARYATKPLHKALYMNGDDFALYERVNGANLQEMLRLAELDCKAGSKQRGVDPERCAPLFMDDARLIDPALYQ